jgi:hypothetical protein
MSASPEPARTRAAKRGARAPRTRATTLLPFAVVSVLLVACAFSAPSDGAITRAAQGGAQTGPAKAPDLGNFKVGFSDAKSDKNRHAKQETSDDEKALQEVADGLNKTIALPRDVYINFDECGEANAFYDKQKHQVTICYELIAGFYDDFKKDAKNEKELDDEVGGATAFVFFHELGHALIDVFDLPVTGREEDAVDQLSTLILADGTDEGEQMVINGAAAFAQESEQELDELAFADEHSLNQQRFYNILCLLYGQNEKKYASLVSQGVLPRERAERCQDEFARADRAWSTLLAPHLK